MLDVSSSKTRHPSSATKNASDSKMRLLKSGPETEIDLEYDSMTTEWHSATHVMVGQTAPSSQQKTQTYENWGQLCTANAVKKKKEQKKKEKGGLTVKFVLFVLQLGTRLRPLADILVSWPLSLFVLVLFGFLLPVLAEGKLLVTAARSGLAATVFSLVLSALGGSVR